MERINYLELQNSLPDNRSKLRLQRFVTNLVEDRRNRNFDSKVKRKLKEYVWDTRDFNKMNVYLDEVVDPQGRHFDRSTKDWHQVQESLRRFTEPDYTSFRWNLNYRKTLEEMKKEFSSFFLKPLEYRSDADIRESLPKLSTHSGFTYLLSGKREKGENMEDIYRTWQLEVQKALESGSFGKVILPAVRTQGSGVFDEQTGEPTHTCKHKTRLVSMVDLNVIITETIWAKPFQNKMALMSWYAGGKDDREISNLITTRRAKFDRYISLDYSNYDQSISSWLIYDAFDIIKQAFRSVDEELWTVMVGDFVRKNFVANNEIIFARKGVPSGSMWTQIIDSIINRVMIKTMAKSLGISNFCSLIMGDDNIIYYSGIEVQKDHVVSYISKNFGIQVNGDKTTHGTNRQDPEFLSRFWTQQGPWRHKHVLISKLLFSERFRNYNDVVTPEHVIYGYILAYRRGMRDLMDVDRFLYENSHISKSTVEWVGTRYIPGAYYFNVSYLENSTVS